MLLAFSLFSWALIFQKSRMFSRMNSQTALFLRIFRSNRTLPDPKQMGGGGSPLEPVYAAGYREVESQTRTGNPPGKIASLNAVTVSMQLAAAEEVRKAETYMSWLATTGSVTPFIGLFGTVWGVMDAFTGLGAAGSASLRGGCPRHCTRSITGLPLQRDCLFHRGIPPSSPITIFCTTFAIWAGGWMASRWKSPRWLKSCTRIRGGEKQICPNSHAKPGLPFRRLILFPSWTSCWCCWSFS